jgi:hypothetical protein
MIDELDWIGFGRLGGPAGWLMVVLSRNAHKNRWIALPNSLSDGSFSWEESMVLGLVFMQTEMFQLVHSFKGRSE